MARSLPVAFLPAKQGLTLVACSAQLSHVLHHNTDTGPLFSST
jgi:hypothetical protein